MIESTNNRHTIATRSYLNVHVSTPDEDYMGGNTGGWWPYRIQHFEPASSPTVNRTRDRSLSYMLTSRTDEHIGPYDLLPLAAELNANFVLPRPIIGNNPYMHGIGDFTKEAAETCPDTDVLIPINASFAAYSSLWFQELPRGDKRRLRHHTYFALDNCSWMNETDLLTAAESLREELGDSVHVHLSDVIPTAQLAQELRQQPTLIDSLSVSPRYLENYIDAHDDGAGMFAPNLLTRDGRRGLATSLDPAVRLATEFSYLCSPLYETDHFGTVADRTSLPRTYQHS